MGELLSKIYKSWKVNMLIKIHIANANLLWVSEEGNLDIASGNRVLVDITIYYIFIFSSADLTPIHTMYEIEILMISQRY